jgi:hypothetical protein
MNPHIWDNRGVECYSSGKGFGHQMTPTWDFLWDQWRFSSTSKSSMNKNKGNSNINLINHPFWGYPLVNKHSYWKLPFIVDLPFKKWWFSIVMLVYQRVLPISETRYGFCMGFSESRRPTPSELIPCLIQGAADCRVWDRRLSHPSPCRVSAVTSIYPAVLWRFPWGYPKCAGGVISWKIPI